MAAYVTWAYALARASVSILGNVIYLELPLATVIAYFWLVEVPTPFSILGGMMAFTGVMIASFWGRGVNGKP